MQRIVDRSEKAAGRKRRLQMVAIWIGISIISGNRLSMRSVSGFTGSGMAFISPCSATRSPDRCDAAAK